MRIPTWLRAAIPAALILIWLTVAGIGGPYFGRIDEVSSNDPTAYLPTDAEATLVQKRLPAFTGSDVIPAVVLFVGSTPLDTGQLAALGTLGTSLAGIGAVAGTPSPPIVSDDGLAAQIFVPLDAHGSVATAVADLRQALAAATPPRLTVYVTGPAGFTGDLVDAFGGIDGILLLVAVAAVLLILIVVYRSPLLPILVLLTSTFALTAALLTVWWIAKAGILLLSGQTQGILFILVIGAATDYSLLYVSRYREALLSHEHRWDATLAALRGALAPILASGGTVIAGLLCLLASNLESNRALGPVSAIGVAFAVLASLTLLPSLLLLAGRAAYWPRRPRLAAAQDGREHLPTSGVWAAVPRLVARRSRMIWIVTVAVLLTACVGMFQLKANGVPASELVLGTSQARTGQQVLAEHFPGGSGSPVYVLVGEDQLQPAADVLLAETRVSGVAVASAASPSGSAPVTADGVQPLGPPSTAAPAPTVSDGQVLLEATMVAAADSPDAEQTVRDLRATLGSTALVGGVTATAVDSDAASIRDRTLIIPLVLVVILLILMLLLRSIVAPLALVGTVVLSFGATMGISALVFNHVLHLPGADPAVPLFGFVFLVALGIDYNIFLMTRVREEALRHGAREGMVRGLAITGGIITSAGLVLAATFAALAVIPILFLLQLAFIVAFGVLLDTIVVRSLLVPALGYTLGAGMWWPSREIRS